MAGKRKCTSEESSRPHRRARTGPLEPQRGALYFDDGNIVIASENVRWRVHASMLGMHSEVLKQMIKVAHSLSAAPIYDNCIVVELLETAEDTELLLSHIYGGDQVSVDF